MNTDPVVMVPFVQLIENYPALYDTTCDSYSDRNAVEAVWREIADKVGEDVFSCKERWKNIRSSYTRWLRFESNATNSGRRKKPYYLAKHLQFLNSYTKPKNLFKENFMKDMLVKAEFLQNSNDTFVTPDEPRGTSEGGPTEEAPEDDSVNGSCGPLESEKMNDKVDSGYLETARLMEEKNKRKREQLESYLEDCFYKRQALEEEHHPWLLFFRSIMSDVSKLTDRQSLQLKLTILEKLKEFSEENDKLGCAQPQTTTS